jgi:hypothetical protein
MKARFLVRSMTTGQVATDFIRLVNANQNRSTADTQPKAPAAQEVLEFFEGQDRSVPVDPIVPIKRLVMVLTEGLRGMPDLLADDSGRIEGAGLYRGLKVRLRGIPERKFIISDIFWEYEEARVREIGTNIEYLLPWDCLRFNGEREE